MIVTSPSRETLARVAKTLPAAPRILARLGLLLTDVNSAIEEITDLLKRDPALTARILRMSNSIAYAGETPVASMEEALVRIGFSDVYRLTGFATAHATSQHLPSYGVTAAQFRENALLTALIMERLAPPAGLEPREAYTAGLLRSVGKIALDRLSREAGTSVDEPVIAGPLADWELGVSGIANTAAAAIILEEWRFPEETIFAVRDHYRPPENAPMACLLNVAAGAAELCGHGWPGERTYWELSPEKLASARIDAAQLADATRAGLETFGPVRAAVA